MTLAQAKAKVRAYGLVLTKKDGEYRVNFPKGREASAYYTNDLFDAVQTAEAMAMGPGGPTGPVGAFSNPKLFSTSCRTGVINPCTGAALLVGLVVGKKVL